MQAGTTPILGENFVIGAITLNVIKKKFSPLGLAWLEWEGVGGGMGWFMGGVG